MIDEHGFEIGNTDTQVQEELVTAVLPHPVHDRLTERVIPLVRRHLSFRGCPYVLCWRDQGVAYYTPVC
jgi:hypothetical protein